MTDKALHGWRHPKGGRWQRIAFRSPLVLPSWWLLWNFTAAVVLLGGLLWLFPGWARSPLYLIGMTAPGSFVDAVMEVAATGVSVQPRPFTEIRADSEPGFGVSATATRNAINSLVARLSLLGGGTITVGAGSFDMSGSILAQSNVRIRGAGMDATTFRMIAAGQAHLVNAEANSPTRFVIEDCTFNGNNLVTTDVAIIGLNATKCRFERCRFTNSLAHGVNIQGSATENDLVLCVVDGTIGTGAGVGCCIRIAYVAQTLAKNNVLFCRIGQSGSFGVALGFADGNCVMGCHVTGDSTLATNEGINLTNASKNRVIGNDVRDRNDGGIVLFATTGTSDHNTVVGNVCENNWNQGISLNQASSFNTVTGNTCRNNNRSGAGQLGEIKVDSSTQNPTFNILSGNTLFCDTAARSTSGIVVNGANCQDNEIGPNTIAGAQLTAELVDTGTRTRVRNTPGGFSTPAALAAGANNDYAPGKFEVLRLTGDGGGTSVINGFTGGYNNRRLRCINISAFNIGFGNQQAGSTATNRIITATAAQVNLPGVDDYADFLYDPTSGRWRLINVTV